MARYIRQGEIGRGSWSVVYKAIDDTTGEVVAIKELIAEAGFPKREVAIGRKVTHRNVCRIHYSFENETGSQCIVMEFVDGGNLRDFMKRLGPAPVEKCLAIVREILDGLEAHHLEKVVHRDLKPENILLTLDGTTVKLSDFGHARVIGAKPSLESQRELGTLAYMAPEQARGLECDARADIFSFGIIFYELLSGTRPELSGPLSFPPGVPRHVQSAIKRCLEIDPARRFKSVSEVRNALSGSRLRRPAPRMTVPLLVALAMVLSASNLLWNSNWGQAPGIAPAPALAPPVVPMKTVPKTIQRVAVMDFENLTGEKPLDPYTVGLSETVSTELGQVRGLTLIERSRVNEAVRELPPARTSQEKGKRIGADTLVTGSFQKLGDKVVLTASVFDAETSNVVGETARVEGSFKDLFKLQAELAKKIATAVHGSIQATAAGRSPDAFEAFSDGLYFLRNDLAADALSKFDLTLSLDPNYPGAHYDRGLALAKLNRLDEAIDAFKRALPRSEPERVVSRSWDAEFASPQHGIVRGMDTIQAHVQRDFFEGRKPGALQKRIVYAERREKTTVLHFLDAKGHGAQRREIPDENIPLNGTAYANDSFTVLPSEDRTPGAPRRIGLYAFSADSSLLWHKDPTDYGSDAPRFGLIGDAFYIHSPGLMRFDLIDVRTEKRLWKRDDLTIDGLDSPTVRHTKAYGDILIFKSQDTYRAIRKSDGTDAWTVKVQSPKVSDLANDRALIVFEPERRIFTVDLETGKTVGEVEIEQYADALPTPYGPKWLVGAILEGNTLYVLSKNLELTAISIEKGAGILWHTPIQKKMQSIRVHGSRLYMGTDAGELIVMNAANGAITKTTKLTEQPVQIDYAGDDAALVRSNNTMYGLGASGAKNWEYPSVDPRGDTTYFNGAVTVFTSPLQMSALDAATGKLLWQYSDSRTPYVFTANGRFFILGENGVKEYTISKPAGDAVTDKETLTELAQAYLAKGDMKQAGVFVQKASDIDGNYPPLVLVRARLLKSGRELARYASLVGFASNAGQRAISELKRDCGLLWETEIGPDVAGDPVLIENRLVSVGRGVGGEIPIVALDPRTGAGIWRYTAERFVSSVAAGSILWYASGFQSDGATAVLYRIDIRTGERKPMAGFHRPARIDQAWIAYAAGRIFVATVSPDPDKGTLQVGIGAFDAGSGGRLWEKSYNSKATVRDLKNPIGLFTAQSDSLTYSIGPERWTVRGTDGSALPPAPQPAPAADPSAAPQAILWPPFSFRIQGGRFYAFTADGHAYAMTPKM